MRPFMFSHALISMAMSDLGALITLICLLNIYNRHNN